ncbi:MAG: hypothetical protein OEY18_01345 [Candidatus Aminicenantes bacterium]|nr:hypothetical protein [Candidatus Aminicenantes bacterium]MDH5744463.1 hypothetical protein [Candidatus Aminicenantes bacterium]
MMKEIECPICWNKDVRIVDAVYQENQDIIKPLMFCDLCEKHYWGDTNGIVTNLSIFCETFDLSPELCYLKKENSSLSKSTYLSKRRLQEFNLLCGFCPYRRLQFKSGLMNVERSKVS